MEGQSSDPAHSSTANNETKAHKSDLVRQPQQRTESKVYLLPTRDGDSKQEDDETGKPTSSQEDEETKQRKRAG